MAYLSGNAIVIDQQGETLASVYTDISNPSIFTKTDMGDYFEYVVQGGYNFSISGQLIIGNPADYSFKEILKFHTTAAYNCDFNINKNGEVQSYGNIEIWLGRSVTSVYSMHYWKGRWYSRGSEIYKPTIRYWFYNYIYQDSYIQAEIDFNVFDWEYTVVSNAYNSSSKFFIFYSTCLGYKNKFINCDFSGSANYLAACFRQCDARILEPDGWYFENCNFKDMHYVDMQVLNSIKFVNCTFEHLYGTPVTLYNTLKGKVFIMAGLSFSDVGYHLGAVEYRGAYAIRVNGACAYLKNNTFSLLDKPLAQIYGGEIWLKDNNSEKGVYKYSGTCYRVKEIDIIIKDSEGNPISDATVEIVNETIDHRQLYKTDADGKPITQFDSKSIIKTEIQTDTTGNTFEAVGGTYYIYASKDGYDTRKVAASISEDNILTLPLHPYGDNHFIRITNLEVFE